MFKASEALHKVEGTKINKNTLDQLDWLTPKDVYYLATVYVGSAPPLLTTNTHNTNQFH